MKTLRKLLVVVMVVLISLSVGGMALAAGGGHGGGGHGGGGHGGGGHGGGGHGGGGHGGGHYGGHYGGYWGGYGGPYWGSLWYYPYYYGMYSWPYYYNSYYPYYYPYGTAVTVPSVPQEYIERSQDESTPAPSDVWYYCRESKAYYPYVKKCPKGWQTVPAEPPSGQ